MLRPPVFFLFKEHIGGKSDGDFPHPRETTETIVCHGKLLPDDSSKRFACSCSQPACHSASITSRATKTEWSWSIHYLGSALMHNNKKPQVLARSNPKKYKQVYILPSLMTMFFPIFLGMTTIQLLHCSRDGIGTEDSTTARSTFSGFSAFSSFSWLSSSPRL